MILSKIGPKLPICPKWKFFLGKLTNPIAPITPQHFKKNLKTDHEIQACLILNYIWAK